MFPQQLNKLHEFGVFPPGSMLFRLVEQGLGGAAGAAARTGFFATHAFPFAGAGAQQSSTHGSDSSTISTASISDSNARVMCGSAIS